MNTKSMRLPPRRVLTPAKRKEREDFHAPKPSTTKLLKPTTTFQADSDKGVSDPNFSNQLLAGYLAHEYLSKGTLFGELFDPSESRKRKPEKNDEAEPIKVAEAPQKKYQRYVEVASLLKTDGAHLAGVVNPTQLARFLLL